jgi:hypothetical protein
VRKGEKARPRISKRQSHGEMPPASGKTKGEPEQMTLCDKKGMTISQLMDPQNS